MNSKKSGHIWLQIFTVLAVVAMVMQWPTAARAQAEPITHQQFKEEVNANTVTILGGSMTGTYLRLADDISRAIGKGNDLRILPIRGGGAIDNIRDILYLRGIDMGMMPSDAMEGLRHLKFYDNLEQRMAYITKLYNAEMHIFVDSKISSIHDLDGKVVGLHGTGTGISGRLFFKRLGIKPAKYVKLLMFEGAAKIKTGEVDAVLRTTGKPINGIDRMLKINPDIKLLPVKWDDSLLETAFFPAKISHEDYPNIVPQGQVVDTVAVGVVLAVYNWKPGTDRYRRLVKFVNNFFANYDKILERKGRHPKWDEVSLSADVPGWKRFPPAQAWLDARRSAGSGQPAGDGPTTAMLRREFERFMKERSSSPNAVTNEEQLFAEFLRWRNAN